KRVLDVGCGHGEYTVRWSETAREVYGLDVTDDFVRTGAELAGSNVTFVTGNTKDRLPFADDFFDGAYNRRGPMSAYADLGRVVRPGGEIVGVHPGDRLWQELAKWFPGLFPALAGSPTMDKLQGYLQRCDYAAEVEAVVSAEYLHEPEDVLRARCFGQVPEILEELKASSLDAVCAIFERHATDQGLPLTFERYLVRAKV
ncbi:MAG TPA: methyltransferase domain-containing protein, partial [Bacilli bacterium]|nr:methyltransferase domain-containing protein [Bacilli bacterium]